MPSNDSTGDADGTFANVPQNNVGEDVSEFVLACIKQLNDCYPQPVDTQAFIDASDLGPAVQRALDLFRTSGLIAGPQTETILTVRGQRSIHLATKAEPKVAQFFSGDLHGDPSSVLLSLWRTHCFAWDRDTFGGL